MKAQMKTPRSHAAKPARKDRVADSVEDQIYARVLDAVATGALLPGTKLGEEQVASAFDVSRERARKVLDRLVHERWLVRIANRGVFVPKPTVEEAKEYYRARCILEAGIVWTLALEITPATLRRLREHVAEEEAAHASGDHSRALRLAGEFHFLLADSLGSADVSRYLQELVAKTRLFMALYHPVLGADCIPTEHKALVDALEDKDAAKVVELAQAHLQAVEARLGKGAPKTAVDLRAVLTAMGKR